MMIRKGVSVTTFIKNVYQPFGGFIKNEEFTKTEFNDNKQLHPYENIPAFYIGLIVDYMTRFMMSGDAVDAFSISLTGAALVNEREKAIALAESITGLDAKSIDIACTLSKYDIAYRVGPSEYDPEIDVYPDKQTIENIIILIERTLAFFKDKELVESHFTFEGAYNDVISAGDGDFLTKEALWDLKVSKYEPTSYNTLQLLIYQILLHRSIYNKFVNIGIFNPKLNCAYHFDMKSLDPFIYEAVESLIDDEPVEITNHHSVGDEVKTLCIARKVDKTLYYNRVNITELVDDIIKGKVDPDELYYTVAYVKITDRVGNILEGEVTGSSYKYILSEKARYTEQFIWRIYNRDFFDYSFFIDCFVERGLDKKQIFNLFNRLRYIEKTVRYGWE